MKPLKVVVFQLSKAPAAQDADLIFIKQMEHFPFHQTKITGLCASAV